MGSTYGCRKKMTQEITVTKTEDHYEMQFEGNDTAYPAPTSAIDKLDDDLTPEETGDSVTFVGEYGGHKHMKNFDVEEVLDAPGDDESDEEEVEEDSTNEADEIGAEPTDEHVEEDGYHNAAGQAQQAEAQRMFTDGGEREVSSHIVDAGNPIPAFVADRVLECEPDEYVHSATIDGDADGDVTTIWMVADDEGAVVRFSDEATIIQRAFLNLEHAIDSFVATLEDSVREAEKRDIGVHVSYSPGDFNLEDDGDLNLAATEED